MSASFGSPDVYKEILNLLSLVNAARLLEATVHQYWPARQITR
jgi:hypothetical protein